MRPLFAGLRPWLLQRVTAVLVLVIVLAAVLRWWAAAPTGHAQWRAFFGDGFNQLAVVGFFTASALHAWVGARDVIIDYVKPPALRLAALVLVAGGLVATVLAACVVLAGVRLT